jgi:selenoprotein W-related protein
VGLATELLQNLEPEIASITLVPSEGGRFEISIGDTLVYSKLQTGRHAEPGEVLGLVQKLIKK